ncbi:MAG: dipeptidyl-peptidase 3 family protein [Acidimicrobiia bacterium]
MKRAFMAAGLASIIAAAAACRAQAPTTPPPVPAPAVDKAVADVQAKSARFAPTDLTADISALPPNEREALAHMVRAAQVMDALFLEQVWAGNESTLYALLKDETPLGKARLHEFLVNKGPWARLDHNEIVIPGAPEKPPSANFYPEGATKADVEKWINSLSGAERTRATGFFHTIRRGPTGTLITVPYSTEYQGELAIAAQHLRAAAAATAQPTLKAFLESRAAAFVSNDYYDSDVKWMELDATIEPTIGPYEVYEDEWFNYKAAFEAFITVKDRGESDKLQKFAASLQDIENNLPIDPKYRNPKLGALAPIAVVNTVFSAGDGNRGVQTAAFNLPNDERVIREKGSKRVMLKNNQQAKFDKVLMPISKVALSGGDQGNVAFEAFFTHILMHELMHGLGPHDITVGGRATTVRQELKETYSAIEEAKADISGLFALQFLVDKGQLDKTFERTIYTTFLASAFRSLRFGVNEAHGRGQAIQLNYLLDSGGFTVNGDGTFAVDAAKIRDGVTALTRDIMTLQAEGSYAKAKQLIDTLGTIRPQTKAVLDKLTSVPVDIEPRFVTAIDLLK